MSKPIKCVTVDYNENSVRVFDDKGGYITSIYRPGLISAQASGTCVVTVDKGHNVTTYDLSTGVAVQLSNRVRTCVPPQSSPVRPERRSERAPASQPAGSLGDALKEHFRQKAIGCGCVVAFLLLIALVQMPGCLK